VGNETQVGHLLAPAWFSQTNEIAKGGNGKAGNKDSRVG